MATPAQVIAVRRKAAVTAEDYDDAAVSVLIDDNNGSVDLAVAIVWEELAAKYAGLVDVTESGSSRKFSSLRTAALENAKYYRGLASAAGAVATPPSVSDAPRVTQITRL